jgi:Amt family ammonium transporter
MPASRTLRCVPASLVLLAAFATSAFAAEQPPIDKADTAWVLVSAALVLLMTPGLALFYGGMVRTKNVLSTMMHSFMAMGVLTIQWVVIGYSLSFSEGGPWIGGTGYALLNGVASDQPWPGYTIPHSLFMVFQMMFAIITPALIVGAIAERMKFSAVMAFLVLWMLVIYFPMAHMVWGVDGFMNGVWNANAGIKAIDFAGGTVVHMTSGWSALVLAIMVGPRVGFGKKPMPPHSLVLTMVGTGMLWVGWYGFNAGSAVAADGVASQAFMTTTLAAAVAGFTWPMLEKIVTGKPTVLGFCSGAVGGLVVITPAAGFVSSTSAVIMGVLAGVVPYFACTKLKAALKYDDALDTFGVHGVGGTLGAILTGVFATAEANPNLNLNLSGVLGSALVVEQLKAVGFTLVVSIVGTVVLASIVKAVIGLRPHAEDEEAGLDYTDHGEAGYHEDVGGGHLERPMAAREEASPAAQAAASSI